MSDGDESHFAVIVDLGKAGHFRMGELTDQPKKRNRISSGVSFGDEDVMLGFVFRADRPDQDRAAVFQTAGFLERFRIGADCHAVGAEGSWP